MKPRGTEAAKRPASPAPTDDELYKRWLTRKTPRVLPMREHVIAFARDILSMPR